MQAEQRLIVDDARDALQRKVLRCELNPERDLILIDFPKRYSGTGATRFTDTIVTRALDQEGALELLAWLQDALEGMK